MHSLLLKKPALHESHFEVDEPDPLHLPAVVRYSPDHEPEWDDFVKVAKNATFLFFREYMDYHRDRFSDYSLPAV